MTDLNTLDDKQLVTSYDDVIMIRNLIITKVQEYGFNANDIMTKNMEHAIEGIVGRRQLAK